MPENMRKQMKVINALHLEASAPDTMPIRKEDMKYPNDKNQDKTPEEINNKTRTSTNQAQSDQEPREVQPRATGQAWTQAQWDAIVQGAKNDGFRTDDVSATPPAPSARIQELTKLRQELHRRQEERLPFEDVDARMASIINEIKRDDCQYAGAPEEAQTDEEGQASSSQMRFLGQHIPMDQNWQCCNCEMNNSQMDDECQYCFTPRQDWDGEDSEKITDESTLLALADRQLQLRAEQLRDVR